MVSPGLFPIPPRVGGAVERHIYYLTMGLSQEHEVYLISDISDNDSLSSVHIREIHNLKFSFQAGFFSWLMAFLVSGILVSLNTLKVYLKKKSFSVIHIHDVLSGLFLIVLKRTHIIRSPIILTIHGYVIDLQTLKYRGIKRFIMIIAALVIGFVARCSDRVIVCSNTQKLEVHSIYKVPNDKIRIVTQAVDDRIHVENQRFSKITNSFSDKTEQYVLFVGRLSKMKGVQYLLSALENTNYRCVLVGGGPDKEEFIEMAKESGIIDRIKFVGEKPFSEVKEFYKSASVFVLPTLAEGFPMVIPEAMSFGLPIVSTNVSGIAEVVINGYNGFIVNPKDVLALRESISIIMNDPKLRNQFGENSRRIIDENFGIKKLATKTSNIYMELIN